MSTSIDSIFEKNDIEKTTMLDGMMAFGKKENGQRNMVFMCTEFIEMIPFIAKCKVQAMHNGDVYMTELPKRQRNKALFRDDNSSLTLGRDGQYYFCFRLPKKQAKEMAERLVRQAQAIADKFEQMKSKKGGKR